MSTFFLNDQSYTSPTATYEAEVIEVGKALLHGCCGIA